MERRRARVWLTLACALIFGPACDQNATPLATAPTSLPVPTTGLNCSVEQSTLTRDVFLEVALTGVPDVDYATAVDFGDGTVERETQRSSNILPTVVQIFNHLYERNGTYVIEATARNTQTNDRLTCTRTVVFGGCLQSDDYIDTFSFDHRWTRNVVTDGPGMSETVSWQASGGNPDGYRRMTHVFTATTAPAFVSLFVYHVFPEGRPSQGPIDYIIYREDRIKFAPLTATSAVGGGALIVQNGVNHTAPLAGGTFSNSGGWESVSVTLRASDFTPVPDFSRTAAPMSFGYYRSNSNRFPLVIEHGIDNWRVRVCR